MSELTLSYAVKLQVSPSQRVLLRATCEQYMKACNQVSQTVWRTHKVNRRIIHDWCYKTARRSFGLGSQMAESVIIQVLGNYKTIKANTGSYWGCTSAPFYKSIGYDAVYNRDYSINIKTNTLSLNTLKGRVKFPMDWRGFTRPEWLQTAKFGRARVLTKNGEWYLIITLTREIMDPLQFDAIIGVDVGIRFLLTAYDGNETMFINGKEVRNYRAQHALTRQGLQSRNTISSKRRLKRIGARENRYVMNENHKASKALVSTINRNSLIIMEDVTGVTDVIKARRRQHGISKQVMASWAFYELRQQIIYKAALTGSMVLLVDPAYTSQRCPACGVIDSKSRDKYNHVFKCTACGYTSNDDRVGAMNIRELGVEWLNGEELFNESLSTHPKPARIITPSGGEIPLKKLTIPTNHSLIR